MSRALYWLRRALRIPAPRLQRDEASQIAQAEAIRRGAMLGRISVHKGLRKWTVWINADVKGAPYVEVDNQTGTITKWASLPR